MNVDVVAVLDASPAVVFFKSTNILSYLAAIRPNITCSWSNLSWMVLMVASVVVAGTPISSRNQIGRVFLCGDFNVMPTWRRIILVENNLALIPNCHTPLLPEVTGA